MTETDEEEDYFTNFTRSKRMQKCFGEFDNDSDTERVYKPKTESERHGEFENSHDCLATGTADKTPVSSSDPEQGKKEADYEIIRRSIPRDNRRRFGSTSEEELPSQGKEVKQNKDVEIDVNWSSDDDYCSVDEKNMATPIIKEDPEKLKRNRPQFFTPRRSSRQREKLKKREHFSLPGRLEEMERITPRRLQNKTRIARVLSSKKANNFIKECNTYNMERIDPVDDFSGSDDLENFIVEDEDEPIIKKRCKSNTRPKKEKKKLKSVKLSDGNMSSEEDIGCVIQKKKINVIHSDDESLILPDSQFSDDELEGIDLNDSLLHERRYTRDASKLQRKPNKKLELLKQKREISKLSFEQRAAKKKTLVSTSESSDSEDGNCIDSDLELFLDDDFVVSDSDEFKTFETERMKSIIHTTSLVDQVNVQESVTCNEVSPNTSDDILNHLLLNVHSTVTEDGVQKTFINDICLNANSFEEDMKVFMKRSSNSLEVQDANGRTVAHIAVLFGKSSSLSFLCKNVSMLNTMDNFNMSPLSYAALLSDSACFQALLPHSDLSILLNELHKFHHGRNLVHLILMERHNVNVDVAPEQIKCLKIFKEFNRRLYLKLLHKADQNDLTPVTYAIKMGHYKLIKFLLQDASLSTFVSQYGGNILHFAIEHVDSCPVDDEAACLKLLIPHLLDQINDSDMQGFTPLMYASERGSKDCISVLLASGASLDCKDSLGATPLHLAALSGNGACVDLLLEYGHKVDCLDSNGWPPLLYANFQAHETCVAALMRANPHQLFVLSKLLNVADENQRLKNRKVVESTIMSLANQDTYYTIFNDFVRNHPGLIEANDNGVFMKTWRSILDFENKVAWFRRRTEERRYSELTTITVDRNDVLGSFMETVSPYSRFSIKDANIVFKGEPGSCEGPKREFLTVLCNEITNPKLRVFQMNCDQHCSLVPYSYFFNRNGKGKLQDTKIGRNEWSFSTLSSLLRQVETVGKIIGACLADGYHLNLVFAKPFVKQILRQPIHHPDDLESLDPELYRSCVKYGMENDVEDLGLSFLYTMENPWDGSLAEVDLEKSNGKEPSLVTNENKIAYALSLSKFKIEECTKKEFKSFTDGFFMEVPPDLLRLFSADEFSLLLNGVQVIDETDWKRNTDYHGCSVHTYEVKWFWKTIGGLKHNEKALLLKFATGTPCVPLGGFKNLTGLGGARKFTISLSPHSHNKIPTAYTCFNRIVLSKFDSEKDLRDKLLIAIRHGSEGFSFG